MEQAREKERVVLLYRASTKKQTDSENDIPLQRDILKPWAESKGWEFTKEFIEGGVSGYKVSATKRDAIIEIKAMAERKEFDILGIYMSDRLGRIAEETPLIVSFLNSRGIKVISYGEGEITAHTHQDKLMTYIRYWQAEGESIKTSMRVKDAGEAQVKAGKWRGGNPPYGYKSVSRGTLNYKGKPIFDVEIDESQAEIVKKIFKMYTEEHYGCTSIAKHLNNSGVPTQKGNQWNGSMINKMLKNKLYTGIYVLHAWTKNSPLIESPIMSHLKIVEQSTYDKASKIRDSNTLCKNPQRPTVYGETLLSGLMYCGECGRKITSHYHHYKRQKKDGTLWEHTRMRYRCTSYHTPIDRKETCHQKTYAMELLDKLVITDAKAFVKLSDREKLLKQAENTVGEKLKQISEKSKTLCKDKIRLEKEIAKIKESVLKSLMGEGDYSPALLNEMLATKEKEYTKTLEKLDTYETEKQDLESELTEKREFAINLDSWETRFDTASIAQQKAMLLNIIDKITIHPNHIIVNYKIETKRIEKLQPILAPSWQPDQTENTQNSTNSAPNTLETPTFHANSGVNTNPLATRSMLSMPYES